MSITINVSQATGGSYTATATNADGVNVAVSSSAADTLSLTVGGGVGPPGAGNVALAAGDGILITSTANVATINCTVEGVPESVLENLSNVLSGSATTGDVLAWNGTTWAANSNFATLTYVDNAVSNLVDAAPGALDTLNELAAAIGDDANFSATITTSLASKAAANHTHTFSEITNGTATVTGNLTLDPSTGGVIISGGTSAGSLTLNCEQNTHGVTIESPAHSENATYTLTLPSSAGSANQVLTTDGTGSLSWSNVSSGSGSGVTTLNTLSGDLTLAAGDNVTLATNGSTLTLSASGGGVSSLDMGTYPRTGSLLTEGGDTLTSEAGDQISPEQSTETTSAALQLLRSNVASAVPSSLAAGELAINTEDDLLFFANSAGVVQSFALGGYAAENHTHAIANVTGLQAALDEKAATASLANVATSGNYSDLANIPSVFAPTDHKSSHATGGSDALTPGDIGAAPAASPTFTGGATFATSTLVEVSSATGRAAPVPTEIRIATTSAGSDWSTADAWGRLGFYSADTSGNGPATQASVDAVSTSTAGATSNLVFRLWNGASLATRGTITSTGLDIPGVITVSATSGSAGSYAPSLTFSGDTNTGFGQVSGQSDSASVFTAGHERVRVRADGNVGIGFAGHGTAKAAVAGAVSQSGGAYPAAVYDACVFYSDPAQGTKNAWAFWSASAPAESQGFSNFGHFLASRVAPSDTSNHYGVFCSVSGATNNYAFFANNPSGAGSFNFYASGSATNYFAGNVGIGTTSPSALLDINADKIRIRTAKTPASASDTGNAGDICWDASYLYICTATNTWRRIAHSTW